MPPKKLTPKQERFAQLIAEGKSQADAYRGAFDVKTKRLSTIHDCAHKVMARPEVAQRVAELRQPIVERVQVTLEGHLKELERLRHMAMNAAQYGPAIKAEELRGKVAGFYTEKHQITGADGLPMTIQVEFVKP